MKTAIRVALAVAAITGPMAAQGVELLVNGDFETGNFTGWSVSTQAGSNGALSISNPGAAAPISGFATAFNPLGGRYYAISDQGGPGAYALSQSFTVSPGATSVLLSFQMFVNDQSGVGPIVNPAGLDWTAGANQHVRVDLLTGAASPFDTGAGVLANYYLGVDPFASNPNPYTSYSFDISSLVAGGGTFQVRFGEVDNQFFLQMGVDNVSVQQDVPEPGSLALLGLGLAGLGLARRRKGG